MPLLFGLGFIVLLVILGILWGINTRNNFVTLEERISNAKSQIGVQMESRWDAVKNLIDATKQYAKHEADVLENITESRSHIGRNASVEDLEKDEEQLVAVVSRLIAVSESYPELKASDVYKSAMESVEKYENNVRQSRMIYNDVVTKYNRGIRVFPASIIASSSGFTSKEYLEFTDQKGMPGWEN